MAQHLPTCLCFSIQNNACFGRNSSRCRKNYELCQLQRSSGKSESGSSDDDLFWTRRRLGILSSLGIPLPPQPGPESSPLCTCPTLAQARHLPATQTCSLCHISPLRQRLDKSNLGREPKQNGCAVPVPAQPHTESG